MIALAVGLVFNVPQLLQRLVPDYTARSSTTSPTTPTRRARARPRRSRHRREQGPRPVHERRRRARVVRDGAEHPGHRAVAQHAGRRGDRPRRPARPGRAHRLLGVLLHQLPALASRTSSRGTTRTATPACRSSASTRPSTRSRRMPRNVDAGAADFGITYPVALDNSLSTWTNYRNRYWPAHYLIDADGRRAPHRVRRGQLRRDREAHPRAARGRRSRARAARPRPRSTTTTPESGTTTPRDVPRVVEGRELRRCRTPTVRATATFAFPGDQPADSFALDGEWRVETQYATPSTAPGGGIRLDFHAAEVRMVLAGEGEVRCASTAERADRRLRHAAVVRGRGARPRRAAACSRSRSRPASKCTRSPSDERCGECAGERGGRACWWTW